MAQNSPCSQVAALLRKIGVADLPDDWKGFDPVRGALERIADEGGIMLVKLDGERGPNDNGRYTFMVSGGRMGAEHWRRDTNSLEDGLARLILHYAECRWT